MASPDNNLDHQLVVSVLVTNSIALVVVSILFLSDVSFFSMLGCSGGQGFICVGNVFTELVSIPFCLLGVIGTATLRVGMMAVAGAWYITTAIILTREYSNRNSVGWEDSSWIALLLFSVVAASLNFSLILAMRNGTIKKQPDNCCKNCCSKNWKCCSMDCCDLLEDDAPDGKGLCLPYNDKWIIVSLALSAVATILSAWVGWPMLLTSIGCMVLLQTLWCNRCSREFLMHGVMVMVLSCSLVHVGFGAYTMWFFQNNEGSCYGWNDYYSYDDDTSLDLPQRTHCVERWSRVTIAFICGLLWFGVAVSLGKFLYIGRYTMWEAKYTSITAAN